MKAVFGMCMLLAAADDDCTDQRRGSDDVQRRQQEQMLKEATSQTGMPAIRNFRERKLLKDILELRDQDGITTYTYLFSEQTGKLQFFCDSIGYGLPYATQYTNPQKVVDHPRERGIAAIPQADPNGLFSPADAEGTWVMCSDPGNSGKALPVYVEPRIVVSPFKL